MAIWQGLLPNFIPPESAGMTGFQQESVGQGKDLIFEAATNQTQQEKTLFLLVLLKIILRLQQR
jgi:hypothetical protein